MRKVLRWRYYCEFCKKSKGTAFAMKTHESGCTLNPHRKCRMCDFVEGSQRPIVELMAILPNPEDYKKEHREDWGVMWHSFNGLDEEVAKRIPALRKATDNCPACIMAALRQRGIPVPCAEGFNYTKECKSVWEDVNSERHAATGFSDY